MPLPGWIPPGLRRAPAEEKKQKAPLSAADVDPARIPERTGYVPGIPGTGIDEYSQAIGTSTGTDRRSLLQELYDVYVACPWSWTCVQVIARTITAGGLYTDWDADTGEGDQEQPAKPPAVIALERFYSFCNPVQDIRQLLRNAIADLLVFGDALLEVVWDGPTPVALYNLDVPTTFPVADDHGAITSWVQLTDFGQRAEFRPEDVIHISLDSARPGVFGVSPTQAMLGPLVAWLFAAGTEKEMLRKGLPPQIHADLPAGLSDPEVTRWDNQYRAQNLGSRNIGNPVKTRGGGKITELSSGKLADVLTAKDKSRDETLSGYGVPPAEAGVIESGNLGGGTGDSQHRGFMINTCDPIAAIVLEKLNFHVAVKGFGVTGWRSKFREVNYRDSAVIEQIRDIRLRDGAWTLNRWRAEIGEPSVDGGDDAVLVDRQNLVLWSDMRSMSTAMVASKAPPVPGAVPAPGPAVPGEAEAARARLREALTRYHAAVAAEAADGGSKTRNAVYAQLGKDFPPSAIAWVKDAAWTGPQRVPGDHIDMADKAQWNAGSDGTEHRFRRKLAGKHARGKQFKPAVLVKTPGSDKYVIADGHHRVLAYIEAGQAAWAYVGTVDSGNGPWLTMATRQEPGR